MSGPLGAGDVFAGYRIESVLGRGGMGVVYRAEDLHLGRTVALKVLPPERASDPGFRDRFLRESKLLASIDHRNIVDVFHADEVDGQLFLVMRFIEGFDLGGLIAREGQLEPRVVAHIIRQAAEALDEAHSHGLVHRDVKPGNVLIAPRGRPLHEARVYLSDFGLTKRADGQSQLTTAGQFLGTPAYVAPEQIQGSSVDGRADLYALACVAYECLTGRAPYHEAGDAAVLMAHLIAPPPDVSAARPELPADVSAVVRRGMAKSRDQRPDTCVAFAVALHEALAPALGDAGAAGTPAPRAEAPDTARLTPPAAVAAPTPSAEAPTAQPGRPRDADRTVVVPPPAEPAERERRAPEPRPPVERPPAPVARPLAAPEGDATVVAAPVEPAAAAGRQVAPPPPGPDDQAAAGPSGHPAPAPPPQFFAQPQPPAAPAPARAVAAEYLPAEDTARGRRTTAIAVGAAVVGLVVLATAAFALGLFGGGTPSSTPSGSAIAGGTASASGPAATVGPPTATPNPGRAFPDASETLLLGMIPDLVRAGCQRDERGDASMAGAVAALECRASGHLAPSVVRYVMYPSEEATERAFDAWLESAQEITPLRNEPQRCRTLPHTGGYGAYTHGSAPGELMCYADEEGRAVFAWSVKVLRIMSEAVRDDGNAVQLYEWWSDPQRSGPLG